MKLDTLHQSEDFWGKICFDGKFRPKGRYQVYRELVTERMMQSIQNISPVARTLLSEKEWWKLLWAYLKASPPKSEILRELAWELSQFCKTQPHPLKKKYPYLGELLEYEYLEIAMRFAPEDGGKTPKGMLRVNPAHVLAEYRWPVHFIRDDFSDHRKMPQGQYLIVLWREPKTLEVKFMEVNPLVASLIKTLEKAPAKGEDLLRSLARKNRLKPTQEYLEEGRHLILGLQQKSLLV